MKKNLIINSRLLSLLLISCLIFTISCKKHQENKDRTKKNNGNILIKNENSDSLRISVHFDNKSRTGINITNKYMRYDYLKFINDSEKDTIVTRTIKKAHKMQIISFLSIDARSGKIIEIRDKYLIDEGISKIEFKYNNGYLNLLTKEKKPIKDNLFDLYDDIYLKVLENSKDRKFGFIKIQLDSIYSFYKKKYSFEKNKTFEFLNENYYINSIQIMEPNDSRIDLFLKQSSDIISGDPINSITYLYIKNNIHKFDFDSLNTRNYSKEYIYMISVGMLNFLSFEDNKGKKEYQSAINWFKTTELYKKDSIYLNKEIIPLNNLIFKEKLKKIKLLNTYNEEYSFFEILKNHSSDYYLIDFWATWCAPCVKGVELMNNMDLPNNISIVSLSLDKAKDKEKWITKTKNLGQEISYLVNEKNTNNQEFLKFLKLQSVPRYILIDKNMNLIDEAFLHPHEPQFLSKLNDLKLNY